MQDISELITIAIPVYERYDYFEDAINSALNQTLKVSIIVVDNSSSHDRFEYYVKSLNNPNVLYYRNQSNVGMVENWNICIENARTKWVSILHSDDMLSPKFAESMHKAILRNPRSIGFVSDTHFGTETRGDFYNPKRNYLFPFNNIKPRHFILGNPIPFPGVLFDKVSLSLRFTKDMYPIADYVFWYQLSLKGNLKFVNRKLAYYRISAVQETGEVYKKIVDKAYKFRSDIPGGNVLERWISDLDTYVTLSSYMRTHESGEGTLSPEYSYYKLTQRYQRIKIPFNIQLIFLKLMKRLYISISSI